ncbi:hypothetical protein [Niastella yeongjuensis]|nr:hypothetical protein [Niastella yeongjuensis]SEN09246.1 hypothetical protein SAMN05660816_00168 [Niastella yeongjuensis]
MLSLFLCFFKLRFTYRTILSVENECSFDKGQDLVVVKDNGYQVALQNI